MREIVTTPTAKGDLSRELSARLDAPYLRFCRVCDATHTYEQPFRLSLLRAGLELEPGTSPPVLRRIPGWRGPAAPGARPPRPGPRGPAPARAGRRRKQVAAYVDSPVREVGARWPEDVDDGRGRRRAALDVLADGRRRADRRRRRRGCAAARSVRPVPAGPRPRDWWCPTRRPARTCGARSAAPAGCSTATRWSAPGDRASSGKKLRLAGGGVVRGERAGRHRRGRPNAWPPSGARRSHGYVDEARPARGSAPCPGRHRRTW